MQLNIKNGKNNTIENFDSSVNLLNLSFDSDVNQECLLTLYGFSQLYNLNLQIDIVDSIEDCVPFMRASLMEPSQPEPV